MYRLQGGSAGIWPFAASYPGCRFAHPGYGLIVEVDGATHSTEAELARDAEQARILTSLGFHIVRVTNIDVYENLEGVQEMIALTLGSIET